MRMTKHIQTRMNQRGITREMIELVLAYGQDQHGKVSLNRKNTQRLLAQKQREIQVIKKILDKGGVVVVEDDNTLVITYNCS